MKNFITFYILLTVTMAQGIHCSERGSLLRSNKKAYSIPLKINENSSNKSKRNKPEQKKIFKPKIESEYDLVSYYVANDPLLKLSPANVGRNNDQTYKELYQAYKYKDKQYKQLHGESGDLFDKKTCCSCACGSCVASVIWVVVMSAVYWSK